MPLLAIVCLRIAIRILLPVDFGHSSRCGCAWNHRSLLHWSLPHGTIRHHGYNLTVHKTYQIPLLTIASPKHAPGILLVFDFGHSSRCGCAESWLNSFRFTDWKSPCYSSYLHINGVYTSLSTYMAPKSWDLCDAQTEFKHVPGVESIGLSG